MLKDLKLAIIFNLIFVLIFVIISFFDIGLFHIVVELSTIIVGASIFVVSYFSKKYIGGSNLVIIGISYMFIGLFDFIHTFGFLIQGDLALNTNAIFQFGISARFFESVIVFLAFSILFNVKPVHYFVLFAIEFFIAATLFAIVVLEVFPTIYIEGVGFSNYKLVIDIVIIFIFLLALILVQKNELRRKNKIILSIAIGFKIASQILFSLNYNSLEFLSSSVHILKFLSYSGFFVIFVSESLTRPYENIFRAFQKKEHELLDLSQRDSLTGLYNHSTSFLKIEELISKAKKDISNLGVIMIDIDDFKQINDKYGHSKGDEILIGVADIFLKSSPPIVFAGRYGGDEFVVAFTKFTINHIEEVTSRIHEVTRLLSERVGLEISLSVGFAFWNHGEGAKDLVNRADKMMYEIKFNRKINGNLEK